MNPTPAADEMTKPITAIPASSFSLPAAASLTIADFVSSPSKPPDKSAVPEPDPSPQVDMAQSKGFGPEQEPDTASAYKKPPARDLTLTAPSPQRSFGQGLPDPNNPVTNLIPSKDQLSPENPYANDPLANNKMSVDTPVGTGPNPSLPSFNQLEQVVAKVYTAKNGQGFIVAIGFSETLTPYEGKSVATVLGQVISLQGTKGIVVDGTKTVRFAAIQTSARSHHSSEQALATTAGGGVSNPAPPPATSLLSTHIAQVTSVAVGNDIFDIRTDKDETASLGIMTIQGEIFHEAGVFILTKPNPSLTGVTPSATLTSNIQILMKTEKIVLTDGYGISISTLAVVYTPATIKTTSLPSAGAGEGNTAIPSINTVDSQTLYHGISQDIFVQGVETVTSMRSSRISNGQGRLLPFLKIVLGSSSTTVQASLPSNIESTKETRADAPRPSITLKELRLGELIVKGFGVGASTTSGGSVTAVAGAGGDGSSAYVNSTDSTSDSKIDNEEDRVMMGRGGRMELTGWGVGLAAFSILMGMWIGIGFG